MRRSTLPQLFKSDITTIKFHPSQRPQKIGGRFAIKLVERRDCLGTEMCQEDSSNAQNRCKTRSQSIHVLQPALKHETSSYSNHHHSTHHQAPSKKSVGFLDSHYTHHQPHPRQHSTSSFAPSSHNPTLHQIHHQNLTKTHSTSTTSPTYSNFPYQTTRSMSNNFKIQLEQADSLKNRVDAMFGLEKEHQKTLKEITKETNHVRLFLVGFKQAYLEDLQAFQQEFRAMCRGVMGTLSLARRETGEETKINTTQTQRLYYEYKDCNSILQLLETRSNALREDCIDQAQLELTNSKTYSYVNNGVSKGVGNNQGEMLVDLRRLVGNSSKGNNGSKQQLLRSGTSHQVRGRESCVNNASRNSIIFEQQPPRAQTTETTKRKHHSNIKPQNDDLLNVKSYNEDEGLMYEERDSDIGQESSRFDGVEDDRDHRGEQWREKEGDQIEIGGFQSVKDTRHQDLLDYREVVFEDY